MIATRASTGYEVSVSAASSVKTKVSCTSCSHIQKLCWLSAVLVTLFLVLWYSRLIRSRAPLNLGLHGYVRIQPTGASGSQFLSLRCGSCAVVSSSGHMLGGGRGSEIDAHECVIRMNAAPVRGFETDVGGHTSVRVVSHTSVPRLLRAEALFFSRGPAAVLYVVWGPEKNMRQDGKGHVFNALAGLARRHPRSHLYTVSREKVWYCDHVFQEETGKDRMKSGAFLSTGFFTMILALDVCDTIDVYGMTDGSYCGLANHSAVPYHYYETYRLDECDMYRLHERARRGGHRFITEKQIYQRWASQGKLHFPYPTWAPQQKS